MGEMSKAYRILLIKSQEKRVFGKPRHRYEGNIKVFLNK
jgi:hypothetical protein